eukprot:SAG11_NODE_917_length_6553_cov_24.570654_7_plen_104_part_00
MPSSTSLHQATRARATMSRWQPPEHRKGTERGNIKIGEPQPILVGPSPTKEGKERMGAIHERHRKYPLSIITKYNVSTREKENLTNTLTHQLCIHRSYTGSNT